MIINYDPRIIKKDGISIYLSIDKDSDNNERDIPIIIIPPAFNKTMRDYFMFSAYFVNNGFTVVRYDTPFHIGLSSGDIFDYKLSESLHTLNIVSDYVKLQFSNSNSYLLGTSLIGRVVIKQLTYPNADMFSHVCLLMPVVDVQDTIKKVTGIDYFDAVQKDLTIKDIEILNHRVSSSFIFDALDNGFYDSKNTIEDLSNTKKEISVFTVEQDEWVSAEHEQLIFSDYKYCVKLSTLMYSTHQLDRNLQAMKTLLEEIVTYIVNREYSGGYKIRFPDFHDLVNNSKLDRNKAYY